MDHYRDWDADWADRGAARCATFAGELCALSVATFTGCGQRAGVHAQSPERRKILAVRACGIAVYCVDDRLAALEFSCVSCDDVFFKNSGAVLLMLMLAMPFLAAICH